MSEAITMDCPMCGEEVKKIAKKCKHCSELISTEETEKEEVSTGSESSNSLEFEVSDDKIASILPVSGWGRVVGWFALANAAIIIPLAIVGGGESILPLILIGATVPIVLLFLSKIIAKIAYKIEIIKPDNPKDEREKRVYELVDRITKRSGLPIAPEVGIYKSEEYNAFATGSSKSDALIAFSSGLVEKMNDEELTAVIAHEMAHIISSDMLISTLLQSVVNIINVFVMLITGIAKYLTSGANSSIVDAIGWFICTAINLTIILAGTLVMKLFSRHREFEADILAAQITSSDYMIRALESLKGSPEVELTPAQQAFCSFKIGGIEAIAELFSTHPPLDKRIERLKEQSKPSLSEA